LMPTAKIPDVLNAADPGEPIANPQGTSFEVVQRGLPERVSPEDRVLVYFSGHATAEGDRPDPASAGRPRSDRPPDARVGSVPAGHGGGHEGQWW